MENLLDDHVEHPNQHKNNQTFWDEKEYLSLSMKEIQWKLRQ